MEEKVMLNEKGAHVEIYSFILHVFVDLTKKKKPILFLHILNKAMSHL